MHASGEGRDDPAITSCIYQKVPHHVKGGVPETSCRQGARVLAKQEPCKAKSLVSWMKICSECTNGNLLGNLQICYSDGR